MKDRLPPNDNDAEQGVLGCCLMSPVDSIPICITRLQRKEALYDLKHRVIFEALVEMQDERMAIDLITIQKWLKDKEQLADAGGVPYIASLLDVVPSASNISYYIDIVLENFIRRQGITTCSEGADSFFNPTIPAEQSLDQIEAKILKIGSDKPQEQKPIKDLVHSALDMIEKSHQNQGALTGLSTGFPDFDKMTTGLHGGEMIVIAARPSLGKTSLAMNIAEHVAVDNKLPVGVFSLEMTAESLVMRTICSRARADIRKIRDGFVAERDFPKLTGASGQISRAPLYIDDSSGLSILQLRAKARRMHQQYGIKLFVIDYLQLLNSTNRRAENRQQEIADISSGVKSLAKELNVPVIVLSQLNRELEKTGGKPKLSYLRESGSIEQDADLVALLYKPNAEDEENPKETVPVDLFIAKQRNGPTGDIHLSFLKAFTRFEQAAKVSENDVPEHWQDK